MIRNLMELTKLRIAVFSMLSVITGYVVAARAFDWGLLSTSLGVLLLALGACALNQWQDRHIDARMSRTKDRPLPAGRMRPGAALIAALTLLLLGFAALLTLHGSTTSALGLFAVVWYNGVYTYLKRVSAFAVVPGSIIGAIPPAMGWVAAGGGIQDPQILALCFFFFIWQVPHFWLLLFAFGSEYAQAGLPTLTSVFTTAQLARLTFLWTVATAASSLLLRVYGLLYSPGVAFALAAAGIALVWMAWRLLLRGNSRSTFRRAFGGINFYALAVMALLILDAMLRR